MNLKRAARIPAVALFALLATDVSDAAVRAASAGKTAGKKLLAMDRPPALDRRVIAMLSTGTPLVQPSSIVAQEPATGGNIVQRLEAQGFSNITGLTRRGENYVFQAVDPYGMKVRVVFNVRTGEIVGLSQISPKKK
ncbi:MAG: hypothetical protein KF835_16005 [Xanthobacteraceae bacterium]|nr:hypothetical protein [Xanthobacteraceae bacterium]